MYRVIQQHKEFNLDELPRSGNMINFSLFNELSKPLIFRNFSIKFVVEGNELYTVNDKKYLVEGGQYLLANSFCEGRVEIDSKKTVKGICIDVSTNILSEVLGSYLKPDSPFPDTSLDTFFNSEQFLENKYNTNNTKLGIILSKVAKQLDQDPYADHKFNNEFYFTLAEKIVEDHCLIFRQLNSINTVKYQTRKDLFRRLCKGKRFLDDNFNEKISINSAAIHASLSEYHFFRLFKAAFNITPQQYLNNKRLLIALNLLRKENHSITEVAIATGFSDVYSFSKSFKKHFGMSPSIIKQ